MNNTPDPSARSRLGIKAGALGLVAAGAISGAVLASTLSANAADSGNTAGTGTGATGPPPADPGRPPQDFGSAPARGDESSVSASLTATLTREAETRTG